MVVGAVGGLGDSRIGTSTSLGTLSTRHLELEPRETGLGWQIAEHLLQRSTLCGGTLGQALQVAQTLGQLEDMSHKGGKKAVILPASSFLNLCWPVPPLISLQG